MVVLAGQEDDGGRFFKRHFIKSMKHPFCDCEITEDVGRYLVMGVMDWCLHNCPNPEINGNLHDCPDFVRCWDAYSEVPRREE